MIKKEVKLIEDKSILHNMLILKILNTGKWALVIQANSTNFRKLLLLTVWLTKFDNNILCSFDSDNEVPHIYIYIYNKYFNLYIKNNICTTMKRKKKKKCEISSVIKKVEKIIL